MLLLSDISAPPLTSNKLVEFGKVWYYSSQYHTCSCSGIRTALEEIGERQLASELIST